MRNRITSLKGAFVAPLTFVSFAVLFCAVDFAVFGQQPKPETPKPVEFRLNPDASKVWANIDQAENDLRRQFEQLENQRATLLIGAGVPQDSRSCKADDKGVVICVKPEQAKAKN